MKPRPVGSWPPPMTLPGRPVNAVARNEPADGDCGVCIQNPMLNGETIRLDGAIRMAPR